MSENALIDDRAAVTVPAAGALFEYGLDSFGKEPARYRVTGWMRVKRRELSSLDFADAGALPGEYGGSLALCIGEILREAQEGREPSQEMEFCHREFATHVSGRGVAGCVAPIGKIRVTGMVPWDQAALDEAERHARWLANQDARRHVQAEDESNEEEHAGGILI